MIHVQINKGGNLTVHMGINGISEVNFTPNLLFVECKLDCTVGDIFALFDEHLLFFEDMFPGIGEFVAESKQKEDEPFDDLESVTVDRFEQVCDGYHSVQLEMSGWEEGEAQCLSFAPISKYVHVPMKVGKTYMTDLDTNDTEEYETSFTLWEILFGVWYEVSFYGLPRDRDVTYKQLEADVKMMQERVDVGMLLEEIDWSLFEGDND